MPVIFKCPAEHGTIDGVMELDADVLTIEFEKQRIFRQPEVVQVDIPIDDIDFAEYKHWIFGGRLKIRTLYLGSAQRIPWRKSLNVDFSISRQEREAAIDLASRIEEAIDAQQHRSDHPSPDGDDLSKGEE